MTELERLKRKFGEECLEASRIINDGQDAPASRLIYLGVVAGEIIDQAFRAGQRDLADQLLASPRLGGHK